jgi:hypothetical protein
MSGKIFYRERRKIEDGDKHSRFAVVAVFDCDIQFTGQHFKMTELETIAKETNAQLVLLESEPGSKKYGLGEKSKKDKVSKHKKEKH